MFVWTVECLAGMRNPRIRSKVLIVPLLKHYVIKVSPTECSCQLRKMKIVNDPSGRQTCSHAVKECEEAGRVDLVLLIYRGNQAGHSGNLLNT